MALIGSLVTIVKANTNNFNKNIKRSGRVAENFGSRLKTTAKIAAGFGVALGAIAVALATRKILMLGTAAITAASDFEESQQRFDVVFRDIINSADMTAKSLVKGFGLSRRESIELLGATGDLLSGFGFTQEKALEFSRTVNELAADLASFTNIEGGTKRASEALTKALLGEIESAKALGIVLQDDDVKARLAAKGLDKLTGQALLQAKATERLNIIIEQSKNAIGDFARSSESTANQQKLLTARIDDLQISLGRGLLPITNAVTGQFIKVAEKTLAWADANQDLIASGILDFVASVGIGVAKLVDILELVKVAWNFMAIGARTALKGILLPLEFVERGIREVLNLLDSSISKETSIGAFIKDLDEGAIKNLNAMEEALKNFNEGTKSEQVRKFFAEIRLGAEKTARQMGLLEDSILAVSRATAKRGGVLKPGTFDKAQGGKTREFITVDLRNVALKAPATPGKTTEEKQLEENKKSNEFLMAIAAQGLPGLSVRAE